MPAIDVDVRFNRAGIMADLLRTMINRGIRKQIFVTEGDVKVNIVKYDAIDTGNMLGSTRAEMTGPLEGQVSVSAESEKGYPYPTAVNFGTRFMAPRPFFSEAEAKASEEFGPRVRREIESAF